MLYYLKFQHYFIRWIKSITPNNCNVEATIPKIATKIDIII